MKYTPILLILVGCAYTDRLEEEYLACGLSKTPECSAIAQKMDKREEARLRREAMDEANSCPNTLVHYTDVWGDSYCLTRDEMRRIMDSLSGRGYGR